MEDTYFNRGPHFIIGPLQMRFGYLVVILIYNAGKRTHDGHEAGQPCSLVATKEGACPLSGEVRTSRGLAAMSAYDCRTFAVYLRHYAS
jgi:hypothetical protein